MPTPPSIIQLGGARVSGRLVQRTSEPRGWLGVADFFPLSIERHRSKLGSNAPPKLARIKRRVLGPASMPPFGRGFV
jgi:hypothetical protein